MAPSEREASPTTPDRAGPLLDAFIREPEVAATLSGQELAELYRQVAHLEVGLPAILLTRSREPSRSDDAKRILTPPPVATILAIPQAQGSELGRRGEVPTG